MRSIPLVHSLDVLVNRRFRVPLLAIGVACTSRAPAPEAQSSPPVPRVVGYLASWGVSSKGTRIAALPARDLTHIFYAFARR